MLRGQKINDKNIHKLIKNSYSYGTIYKAYESYLYNKGWIDCLEQLGYDVNISNCHTLNGMLLDEYNKLIK